VVIALISLAFSAGHGASSQRVLLAVLTAIWGVRLGGYIALRQRGAKEDPRYTDMLDRAAAAAPGTSRTVLAARKIYLTQGVVLLFVSLPVQVGMYEAGGLGVAAYLGVALWLLGLVFETVGDFQMARFKADPGNKGKIMDRGLWGWTRHPNYFGDACVWWGLFLVAAGHWPGVLTVASPLLMNVFLARGTGKATLEKHMGDRPGFAEYLASTSGFLPLPPPVSRALHLR
jgi:steroid 5-alpha reductase family enzyme